MPVLPDAEEAQNAQIDSFRFLSKDGRSGRLSIVSGGCHYLFPCTLIRALHGAESIMEVARKNAERVD